MEISREEVKKIADMAHLKLSDSELDNYLIDMKNILNLAAQLSEVDTCNITPMAHPLEDKDLLEAIQTLRPDLVRETPDRDYFQSIAPQTENGYYLVPKVIGGTE
jgi:aspartyl-tRNA(Asn)/glutamyl-tRNA(Gln) amidotransferase subunit C